MIQEFEIWKDIEGYEGCYQVSSLGRIKSLSRKKPLRNGHFCYSTEKILNQSDRRGYACVVLSKTKAKPFSVHRLVANAFVPNTENKKTVNHKNGDKKDNRVSNLEWATQSEQQLHASSIGLRNKARGSNSNLSKLTESDIKEIFNLYNSGKYYIKQIADRYKVGVNAISSILNNYTWGHLGFKKNKKIDHKNNRFNNRISISIDDLPVVWHLSYIHKLGHRTIGKIMGCPPKTVFNIINDKKYLTLYNDAQYK